MSIRNFAFVSFLLCSCSRSVAAPGNCGAVTPFREVLPIEGETLGALELIKKEHQKIISIGLLMLILPVNIIPMLIQEKIILIIFAIL